MRDKNTLNGTIVRGLGEGTYFMSMQHYKKEIKKRLGFNAYPGTLNIKVDKKCMDFLKNITPIKIDGFKSNNKKFGSVVCYKSKLKGVEGSIIIPELNKHKKNILEFIAPFHLKSELKLEDGDKVKIEVEI